MGGSGWFRKMLCRRAADTGPDPNSNGLTAVHAKEAGLFGECKRKERRVQTHTVAYTKVSLEALVTREVAVPLFI